MACNQNHFTVNVQKKSQEGKTVENTEQFTLKRMIVTESKSSIRYKTSRRKWVPRAEENVVIQNQTTCTIFHHQEGWEFDPLPPPHPPRPLPTQKVYLHLTWEETGQINRSEGNKAKYVSSWYSPLNGTRKSCDHLFNPLTIDDGK